MRNVHELVRENRQECMNILKNEGGKHEFAHFDNEEGDWCDDEGPVDLGDVCPFVTYADNDGNIKEYAVTSLSLGKECSLDKEETIMVNMVNPYYYKETMEIPVSWLYGISECYIYDLM